MALNFTVESHSALFGINCDIFTHSQMIQAATCFLEIRTILEKKKAEFASMTPRQFKNRRVTFRTKVEDVVAEDKPKAHWLFMPLITNNGTMDGLKRFILACTALTITQIESLAERNLTSVFPHIFEKVFDAVPIPPETIRTAVDLIRSICKQTDSASSQTIQDILDKVYSAKSNVSLPEQETQQPSLYEKIEYSGNLQELHNKRPLPETNAESNILLPERQAKRPCLSEPEIEFLRFNPEALETIGALNVDQPPDHGSRRILVNFTQALANKLPGIFGNAPFFLGVQASRQWRWERAQDGGSLKPETACAIAMVPDSDEHDFSFIFTVGNATGWAIADFLGYTNSSELERPQIPMSLPT